MSIIPTADNNPEINKITDYINLLKEWVNALPIKDIEADKFKDLFSDENKTKDVGEMLNAWGYRTFDDYMQDYQFAQLYLLLEEADEKNRALIPETTVATVYIPATGYYFRDASIVIKFNKADGEPAEIADEYTALILSKDGTIGAVTSVGETIILDEEAKDKVYNFLRSNGSQTV
jgi:hypothetical protein